MTCAARSLLAQRCPSPYFPPFDVLLPEPAIAGEDGLNLNIWTRCDLSRRATTRFDTSLHVVDDPRAEERALWEGVR
jgi:hypothetical protein